jgi:hypothetical protein
MWAMNQSFYAEAAHLAAARRYADLTWLVVRTGCYLGAFGTAVLLAIIPAGSTVLEMVAGPEYIVAALALSVIVAAQTLSGMNVGLRGALPLTAGPAKLLIANLIAFAGFSVILILATSMLGISGAGTALLVFELIALTLGAWQYWHWLRHAQSQPSYA